MPLPIEYFALNQEERSLIEAWENNLPPIIARKHVDYFTGGILTRSRLAEADCRGEGPADPIRIGRCVSYWTRHLLAWLVKTRGVNQTKTLSPLIQKKVKFSRDGADDLQLIAARMAQDEHNA